MEKKARNNKARSSLSGGIEGRPISECRLSKRSDKDLSAVSVIRRMGRSG
jgi:hypothetical protein